MSAFSDDTELLLHAYMDGELDAASALVFDRRLEAEPELAAARDRVLALRSLLRTKVARVAAPDRLRQAMLAGIQATSQEGSAMPRLLGAGSPKPVARRWGLNATATSPDWRMGLAACLVGALLGASGTALIIAPRAPAPEMAEVVADHLRAVMAPQPFDVASSDGHTVKPWFTGRLTFAPQVFDLAQAGFPLAGGRVDVVDGEPAAALVFRHGRHLISLISQPVGRGGSRPAEPSSADRGFQVREWTLGTMRYWAISDVAAEELDKFETAARAVLSGAD